MNGKIKFYKIFKRDFSATLIYLYIFCGFSSIAALSLYLLKLNEISVESDYFNSYIFISIFIIPILFALIIPEIIISSEKNSGAFQFFIRLPEKPGIFAMRKFFSGVIIHFISIISILSLTFLLVYLFNGFEGFGSNNITHAFFYIILSTFLLYALGFLFAGMREKNSAIFETVLTGGCAVAIFNLLNDLWKFYDWIMILIGFILFCIITFFIYLSYQNMFKPVKSKKKLYFFIPAVITIIIIISITFTVISDYIFPFKASIFPDVKKKDLQIQTKYNNLTASLNKLDEIFSALTERQRILFEDDLLNDKNKTEVIGSEILKQSNLIESLLTITKSSRNEFTESLRTGKFEFSRFDQKSLINSHTIAEPYNAIIKETRISTLEKLYELSNKNISTEKSGGVYFTLNRIEDLKKIIYIPGNQYFFEAKAGCLQVLLENLPILIKPESISERQILMLNYKLSEIESSIDSAVQDVILNSYYFFMQDLHLKTGFDGIYENFLSNYEVRGFDFYPFLRENKIKIDCQNAYSIFLKKYKFDFKESCESIKNIRSLYDIKELIKIGRETFVFGSGKIYAKINIFLANDFIALMESKFTILSRIKFAQMYLEFCSYYQKNKKLPDSLNDFKINFDPEKFALQYVYSNKKIQAVFKNLRQHDVVIQY